MTENSNKIKELFQELERLQHNDKVYYVTFEDWESGLRCPSFYLGGDVYYELHHDGVLRYWYPHMKDEGIEAKIDLILDDLRVIKAKTLTQYYPFIQRMEQEIENNQHKGNWLEYAIKENRVLILTEIYHHLGKLELAVQDRDEELIKEYSADIANIAMFMFKTTED